MRTPLPPAAGDRLAHPPNVPTDDASNDVGNGGITPPPEGLPRADPGGNGGQDDPGTNPPPATASRFAFIDETGGDGGGQDDSGGNPPPTALLHSLSVAGTTRRSGTGGGTPPLPRPRHAAPALAALAALALAARPGCDAGGAGGPDTPPPIGDGSLPAQQQALVVQAFEDVEGLFALGFDGTGGSLRAAARRLAGAPVTAAAVTADTTTYTGVFNATASKGYLVTLEYRQPQGVGIWRARVQHARAVDHDGVPATPALTAVETVTLTFLTAGDLDDFLADLEAGTVAYLLGTSNDAEAAFAAYDTWSVAQLYSPGAGLAVVNYTNTQLRESVTVRDPVVTLNADGTGTVRDGGAGGAVRTRYFGADFALNPDGSFTGTLLRTLLTSGSVADGAVTSRTEFPDASWRQTKQRGGDGVVVRENTQG